jgi:hypothetical protein
LSLEAVEVAEILEAEEELAGIFLEVCIFTPVQRTY